MRKKPLFPDGSGRRFKLRLASRSELLLSIAVVRVAVSRRSLKPPRQLVTRKVSDEGKARRRSLELERLMQSLIDSKQVCRTLDCSGYPDLDSN